MDPYEAKAMSIIASEQQKMMTAAVAPNVDSSELSGIQSEGNRFNTILASYQKAKTELSKKLLRDVQNEARNLDNKITTAEQTPIAA